MKIAFDNQIYQIQKFGGINRYFDELKKINEEENFVGILNNVERIENKQDFLSKSSRYFRRKLSIEKKSNNSTTRYYNNFSTSVFDIFHPTYYNPYFLEFTNKPFVLTVHDMIHEIYSEFFSSKDKTSHYKRLLCKKASKIVTVSLTTKHDLIDLFDLPEEKVHTIPLASDFDKLKVIKPENADKFENYILIVGNRSYHKNFYYSAFAIADVLKADRDLKLLCTGNPFRIEELNLFESLGITDRIMQVFLKNDNELAWVYRNARILIFPSLYEGFGFPLLEAFASDCPVVSSSAGSLKEVGGSAPLYFEPKNINDMRDKIHEALYNSTRRSAMIENGRLQLENFSWDTCRKKTLELYESIPCNSLVPSHV